MFKLVWCYRLGIDPKEGSGGRVRMEIVEELVCDTDAEERLAIRRRRSKYGAGTELERGSPGPPVGEPGGRGEAVPQAKTGSSRVGRPTFPARNLGFFPLALASPPPPVQEPIGTRGVPRDKPTPP